MMHPASRWSALQLHKNRMAARRRACGILFFPSDGNHNEKVATEWDTFMEIVMGYVNQPSDAGTC